MGDFPGLWWAIHQGRGGVGKVGSAGSLGRGEEFLGPGVGLVTGVGPVKGWTSTQVQVRR
ncbi:hypothetical protein SAMN04487818_104285 [Actinokineospora terrae]|uniref:Uncharacterized protein n=1 Tax=Actinokineospora terrae TaxID=155974 RepID=A0A1H9QI38_9PSEU|nr:hypothetical protein SAMN04487818_104285 [Actinokineospora terrae]